jgi:hypothetical protein
MAQSTYLISGGTGFAGKHLINSQLVVPHKLVHETPFEFSFGDFQSAIDDILSIGAMV